MFDPVPDQWCRWMVVFDRSDLFPSNPALVSFDPVWSELFDQVQSVSFDRAIVLSVRNSDPIVLAVAEPVPCRSDRSVFVRLLELLEPFVQALSESFDLVLAEFDQFRSDQAPPLFRSDRPGPGLWVFDLQLFVQPVSAIADLDRVLDRSSADLLLFVQLWCPVFDRQGSDQSGSVQPAADRWTDRGPWSCLRLDRSRFSARSDPVW